MNERTIKRLVVSRRRMGGLARGFTLIEPFDKLRVRKRKSAAFTLIELLLVLVILATLAAVVVPKFTGRAEQTKITAAEVDIANMGRLGLNAFEVDCGRYPTTAEGLNALVEQPANADGWKGPYIERGVPKDQWGNPYKYRCPGLHNKKGYDLSSFGPDGEEGSDDDIDNWSTR